MPYYHPPVIPAKAGISSFLLSLAERKDSCLRRNDEVFSNLIRFCSILFCVVILSGCGAVGTTLTAITKGGQLHEQDRTLGDGVSDLVIETTINHRYFRTDINDLFQNVDVDVIEGRAFLTGNVKQHQTMIKAVDLAWEVKGVKEVINELQVENKSDITNAAEDVWIELQIESSLLVAKGVKSSNYNAESVNGIVALMGIAQDDAELNKVTDIISRTRGVRKVVSHVIMANDPRRIIPKSPKPETHLE
jgi:osmotically-inducible protein OsmY